MLACLPRVSQLVLGRGEVQGRRPEKCPLLRGCLHYGHPPYFRNFGAFPHRFELVHELIPDLHPFSQSCLIFLHHAAREKRLGGSDCWGKGPDASSASEESSAPAYRLFSRSLKAVRSVEVSSGRLAVDRRPSRSLQAGQTPRKNSAHARQRTAGQGIPCSS